MKLGARHQAAASVQSIGYDVPAALWAKCYNSLGTCLAIK